MEGVLSAIDGWFRAYYADGIFLLYALISYIYLFIKCKELRKKFLLPIAIILLVVLNPILYKYIYSKIIYWRLFWMIPNGIITAAAMTVFIKSQKETWKKFAVLAIMFLLVIIGGTNTFHYGNFSLVKNWEKISVETKTICDIMLEKDDSPRVIVPAGIFSEVRQYAPEISMMYGRNAHGYITYIDETARNVFGTTEQEQPDYHYVLSKAVELAYNFVVVVENKGIDPIILEQYGYEEIERTLGYIIYYNEEIEL